MLTTVYALVAMAIAAHAVAAREPSIGITTLALTKPSATTGEIRHIPTTVWYPAVRGTGTPTDGGDREGARVRGRRLPLVVFSHGSCGRPNEATYLTRAMAAAGYIVAAPRHTGNTADEFPECAALPAFLDSAANRVPDVRYAIDALDALDADPSSAFFERLHRKAIAVMGLSFGGFTTLATALDDPRVRAAFALVPGGSGFLGTTPITTPTLVIGAERDRVVGFAESESAYGLLTGPRVLVELLGGNHLSAVDSCFNADLNVDLCVPEDIPQDDAHRLILRYAVPFFRRHLARRQVPRRVLTRAVDGVIVTTPRGVSP